MRKAWENKYLLLLGERMYEESIGDRRYLIQEELHKYEQALNSYESAEIERAKEAFRDFLKDLEEF